jgi:hypothetical protein
MYNTENSTNNEELLTEEFFDHMQDDIELIKIW